MDEPRSTDAEWRDLVARMRSKSVAGRLRIVETRAWFATTLRAVTDLSFEQPMSELLIRAVYLLGLSLSLAVPLVAVLAIWLWSPVIAVIVLLTVAPVLALALAATVRIGVEFIMATQTLASQVGTISEVAEDLHRNVNGPLAQISGGLQTVSRWRPGARKD